MGSSFLYSKFQGAAPEDKERRAIGNEAEVDLGQSGNKENDWLTVKHSTDFENLMWRVYEKEKK